MIRVTTSGGTTDVEISTPTAPPRTALVSRRLWTVSLRDEDSVAERYRSVSAYRAAERYARACGHPGVYHLEVTGTRGELRHVTITIR